MTGENRPLTEMWREAADAWNEKDAAARLLEDTKSLVFAKKCAELGEMPVNKAEQKVKSSQDWYDYVVSVVDARTEANAAKIEMEYRDKQYRQNMNDDANHRAEARL